MTKGIECIVSKIESLKSVIKSELMQFNRTECLSWLDNCCSDLTCICKYMHKLLLKNSSKIPKNGMDLIFLALRQLIACVTNLERISMIEQKEDTILKICRQHFQERMIHCLSRLSTTVVKGLHSEKGLTMNETNFVIYMDNVLDQLAPLALNVSYDANQTSTEIPTKHTEAEFLAASRKIRDSIEMLLGQVLVFTCVVSNSDKIALNTLCHRVMKVCIDFQMTCLNDDPDNDETKFTEIDKRLKAQQLQNILHILDCLMNECFLRVFFTTFAECLENPLRKIQNLSKNALRDSNFDEMTEKFDETLDRLIQIGHFGSAYSTNAKGKSNLQSCLASFEAISISLVPSILSGGFERDATYLEEIWNETIHDFRRSIQEIINTNALCTVLIDLINNVLHASPKTETNNESKTIQLSALKSIVSQCEILAEHIHVNADELELNHESQLKIYFNDFKLILNECKACLKVFNILDEKRITKRFQILLSSIKKISKLITIRENMRKTCETNNEKNDEKPFTFGHVTLPEDNVIDKSLDEQNVDVLSDSMNVIVDLNEFIGKNDAVKAELTHRNEVFYARKTPRKVPKFSMISCDAEPKLNLLKRSPTNVKRCSKRTSLRVAMFKRQKWLDTQKFITDSISQSKLQSPCADSLNLQITDILEQLSKCSTNAIKAN